MPRLPGLNIFITSDENTNIFLAGSQVITAFLHGDFRGTYWHFYPGVTMSWLDALGMSGQYLVEFLRGTSLPLFTEYIHRDIRSLLVANRLPYVFLTAVAIPLIYLLAKRLFSPRVALLGALLLAFDPFFLAHSRVVHGDAPVAVFMTLSALTLFIHFEGVRQQDNKSYSFSEKSFARPYSFWKPKLGGLILSAICGGLAALTKAPGHFMAPFAIGLTLLYIVMDWANGPKNKLYLLSLIFWGGISLTTFILLWPAMWVDPVGTIQQMLRETFGKVNEGHLVYFFGQATLDPGPWFYLYVIPFRLTPITLIGGLLSFIMVGFTIKKPASTPLRLMWFFVITLFLFGNLSPKKQDRYLLPLFPFLDLLAAVGWLGLLDFGFLIFDFRFWIGGISKIENRKSKIIFALFLLHLIPTFTYYPYYLAYFNPLMGGPTRAAETTLMGWGEGMEQAADYLNHKANAKNLYVASTPSQTFLPYFVGTGENFYSNDIAFRADFVILYLAQWQRLAPSPDIVRYFLAQTPEKVIFIKDVPYIKIYPNEKRILTDIPPQATPINIGLGDVMRLAGYQISSQNPLTLYWHALSPLKVNYTISVRAFAADGHRLTQHDSWPLNGLLPTSQWRPGDYVADTPNLSMSATDWDAVSRFEIVVYNADTQETLGAPMTIRN